MRSSKRLDIGVVRSGEGLGAVGTRAFCTRRWIVRESQGLDRMGSFESVGLLASISASLACSIVGYVFL